MVAKSSFRRMFPKESICYDLIAVRMYRTNTRGDRASRLRKGSRGETMKYLVQLRPPQFMFLLALSLTAIAGLAIQSEAVATRLPGLELRAEPDISITFDDSTDTISVSTTDFSNRVRAVSCPDPTASFENCIIFVSQPSAGATISSANFPFQPVLGNTTVGIGDPGGSTVSDLLNYGPC